MAGWVAIVAVFLVVNQLGRNITEVEMEEDMDGK